MQLSSSAKISGRLVGISKLTIFVQTIGYAGYCTFAVYDSLGYQGVYVLQDNSFKPITRISSWEGRADAIKKAKLVSIVPLRYFHSVLK